MSRSAVREEEKTGGKSIARKSTDARSYGCSKVHGLCTAKHLGLDLLNCSIMMALQERSKQKQLAAALERSTR